MPQVYDEDDTCITEGVWSIVLCSMQVRLVKTQRLPLCPLEWYAIHYQLAVSGYMKTWLTEVDTDYVKQFTQALSTCIKCAHKQALVTCSSQKGRCSQLTQIGIGCSILTLSLSVHKIQLVCTMRHWLLTFVIVNRHYWLLCLHTSLRQLCLHTEDLITAE